MYTQSGHYTWRSLVGLAMYHMTCDVITKAGAERSAVRTTKPAVTGKS